MGLVNRSSLFGRLTRCSQASKTDAIIFGSGPDMLTVSANYPGNRFVVDVYLPLPNQGYNLQNTIGGMDLNNLSYVRDRIPFQWPLSTGIISIIER